LNLKEEGGIVVHSLACFLNGGLRSPTCACQGGEQVPETLDCQLWFMGQPDAEL
jgi:hypothetical protein